MNISYKWLKDYVDFDLTPQQVCDALTSTGLEVDALEEVQSIRGGLKGLYVGKVLTCEAHPNSDHLHVTTVDLGKGEPSQIVCGAPNVAAGQKVIVADLGCVLYDGDNEFVIKKSKLRGVESCVKAVFAFRPNRVLYSCLHPSQSFAIARFFSRKSRAMTSAEEEHYMGDDKEYIVQYCQETVKNEDVDYFIYGHRHLVIEKNIGDKAVYFNTGDWIRHYSYLEFTQDGKPLLKTYSTNPD